MGNKKVAIITMHKVINFGSALQAWALQECVNKMGYEAKLIDYRYPNKYYFDHAAEEEVRKRSLLKRINRQTLVGFIKRKLTKRKKQVGRFHEFWSKYFNSTKPYFSVEELRREPPEADIYLTGSDQVWNPCTMYGDPAFFLDFGRRETPRISYASSFSTNVIPEKYNLKYADFLNKYDCLGLREKEGCCIVRTLTGKKSALVCDPTLLLTRHDYAALAEKSQIKMDRPYLLAYILEYAYNPYPAIGSLISQVSKLLKLHVVYLLCGSSNGYRRGTTTISDAGPCEFVRLFADADYVVTSSFHGTAFSLIHQKSFYAVTPSEKNDSRISSLLSDVGLSERGIPATSVPKIENIHIDYSPVNLLIEELRLKSLTYLHTSLS